ncbi:hypothetical protein EYC80_005169 [Monilinia laxa]|uniref:coproporphyrinogen oxidase n=1 Tax=Monilinia laxa TaxID=61186 RepID=A0A5N6KJ45_MONLA|nr:hypothetical protein EYC80_005169 [Monilinia laxa]
MLFISTRRSRKHATTMIKTTILDSRNGATTISPTNIEGKLGDQENTFAFAQSCLKAFLPSYLPIINKRKDMPYTEKEKEWQQIRRGRYVEFNLVHDRGTAFGLNTPSARVESILMSLPLTASWRYMYEPEKGSREQRLVDVLREPKEWV